MYIYMCVYVCLSALYICIYDGELQVSSRYKVAKQKNKMFAMEKYKSVVDIQW